jgi:hypothetical protein
MAVKAASSHQRCDRWNFLTMQRAGHMDLLDKLNQSFNDKLAQAATNERQVNRTLAAAQANTL